MCRSGEDPETCRPPSPSTICTANRDYVLIVDNSASMIPVQDLMSEWMRLFVKSFKLDPDKSCSPRIGIVAFNGPPIGCTWRSTSSVCRQTRPYPLWVEKLVPEPTADEGSLLTAIASRSRAGEMTCISCALEVGTQMLVDAAREGSLPGMLILLTDGRQTAGGTDASAIYRANEAKAIGLMVASVSYGNVDQDVMVGRERAQSAERRARARSTAQRARAHTHCSHPLSLSCVRAVLSSHCALTVCCLRVCVSVCARGLTQASIASEPTSHYRIYRPTLDEGLDSIFNSTGGW